MPERHCNFCGQLMQEIPGPFESPCFTCTCEAFKERNEGNETHELERMKTHPEIYLKRFEVPRRYLGYSLSNFEGGENIKRFCREYAEGLTQGSAGNIFFTGPCGSGKTHLAAAILRQAVCSGYQGQALFTTAPEILLSIREAFDDNSTATERQVIDKYSSVNFLIMDDVGAEKPSEYAIATLFIIIDRRNRELKPTIFTSNLTLGQIGNRLSERVASRLSEAKLIATNLPDRRKVRTV